MTDAARIQASLREIRRRVDEACARAGREPSSVTLVAVSKTHPAEAIRAAYDAGQRDFGENYAQELAAKRTELADLGDIRWHFIGALQSNKAKLVIPGCVLVHAVDRESVAEALARRALAAGTVAEALVEVNVGDESSKAGVPIEGARALIERLSGIDGLRLRGLMCIPPPCETPDAARPFFSRLRVMRDELRAARPGFDLLSMGMTWDFEAAIAEGATHVRVGTAIFGARG
jgi:pyridoxal phosphate enzyme (YggS family)